MGRVLVRRISINSSRVSHNVLDKCFCVRNSCIRERDMWWARLCLSDEIKEKSEWMVTKDSVSV